MSKTKNKKSSPRSHETRLAKKPDTSHLTPDTPTYIERAAVAKARATRKLVQSGSRKLARGMEQAKESSALMLEAINSVREAGTDFIAANDSEQMTFLDFGAEWFDAFKDCLVDGLTKEQIRAAVKLARDYPAPLKSIEDCKPAVQLVLIAAGELPEPHRLGAQTAHERNLFSDFVTGVGTLKSLAEKLEEEKPMLNWSEEQLRKFVEAGRPVVAKVHQAEGLLPKETINAE